MKSRPKSLTVIATVLLTVFGLSLITRGPSGIEALFVSGPLIPRLKLVYLDIVWGLLVVGGFGLFRGASWSRPVVIVAFVGLWLATISTSSSSIAFGVASAAVWGAVSALLFTKKAKAFFSEKPENTNLEGE